MQKINLPSSSSSSGSSSSSSSRRTERFELQCLWFVRLTVIFILIVFVVLEKEELEREEFGCHLPRRPPRRPLRLCNRAQLWERWNLGACVRFRNQQRSIGCHRSRRVHLRVLLALNRTLTLKIASSLRHTCGRREEVEERICLHFFGHHTDRASILVFLSFLHHFHGDILAFLPLNFTSSGFDDLGSFVGQRFLFVGSRTKFVGFGENVVREVIVRSEFEFDGETFASGFVLHRDANIEQLLENRFIVFLKEET